MSKGSKNMDRRRVISHIWMWSLIGAGVVLAFWNIPSGAMMPFDPGVTWILVLLLGIVFIYHLISSVILRANAVVFFLRDDRLIGSGTYAKASHPTCTTAVILGWMLFVIFPDFRMLISVLWMTLVVVFWIWIEESAFQKKRKTEKDEDDAEVG